MTVRPPRARALSRVTTWKQDELSKPLQAHRKVLLPAGQKVRLQLNNNNKNGSVPDFYSSHWAEPKTMKTSVSSDRTGPNREEETEPGQNRAGQQFFSPGGLIKEHDWRIVDELQSDGQPLPLTPRQVGGPRFCTVQQT